ncbi:MAG: methylated-DNA--[protein]-cysteine S-methyltransferase [Burkholderiales bacterium]|nr:methylated-DNA--[protein]-cysteine S-methyltransferase [Burkholderiales bacterium]
MNAVGEQQTPEQALPYAQVARAIEYLRAHARRQPRLAEVAAFVGLSESEFQRRFSSWAGISPKRFLQFLSKEYAKEALRRSASVLEAAFDAGLSSPGRLHDLLVTCEAVTPGEVRAFGDGVSIRCGFHPSPFGEMFVAVTPRGVCRLAFVEADGRDGALDALREEWPRADVRRDDAGAADIARRIFGSGRAADSLHLWVKGSNFQLKVWEALLRIPAGCLVSYRDVARAIGRPDAPRAVGSAVAANPVALLIPCHRVIRASGDLGEYRWGLARKATLIASEAVAAL